jgi:hypothetical protein
MPQGERRRRRSPKAAAVVLVAVLLAPSGATGHAQEAPPPLVNLSRLSIAAVFASGANGGRSIADPFYGVRNAFDGGRNLVNGINYSSWGSASAQDYVLVRFARAVTVSGVAVSHASSLPGAESLALHTRGGDPSSLVIWPTVELAGPRSVHALAAPVAGVSEITLHFSATSAFHVGEIEVLGPPPEGVDLTAVTPALAADLLRPRPAADTARRLDAGLIHTLVAMELDHARVARRAVDHAATAESAALAWLRVNRAMDRVADLLWAERWSGPSEEATRVAEVAAELGVALYWCELGSGGWAVATNGYDRYLELSPSGPAADEAWWMAHLLYGPRCRDCETSAEEFQQRATALTDFLARFPSTVYAPQARDELHRYRELLAR